eukprot:TRINITY_DN1579_c0_g1_i2.p1 TRINITY_DN1579_c0_g1~~TRINITY_DN1579_c0_g1_i2.p1  ORF type:complete len:126 (+),score=52.48 TRINITY_DN1579_c0_g1_i2:97-474(+)
MIRRPPRSTQSRSSAASDVYKRQVVSTQSTGPDGITVEIACLYTSWECPSRRNNTQKLSNQVITPCSLTPLTKNTVTGVLDLRTALRKTSVSYTHLRAHETVLDLVCRLLLEKKNRKKDRYNKRH